MRTKLSVKKHIAILALSGLFALPGFSRHLNELVRAGSWVYSSIAAVAIDSGRVSFADRMPLSIREVKFFLDGIDYDSLSEGGRTEYDRILSYCNEKGFEFGPELLTFGVEPEVAVEGYYKSEQDVNWNYDRYRRGTMLLVPAKIEAGDYLTMSFDAKLGQNKGAMAKHWNFTNLIYDIEDIDINFPDTGYLSTGCNLGDRAGLTFQIGQGARSFGRSLTGNVVQSEYFTGASYADLNLYCNYFRYEMLMNQFSVDKYMYIHEIAFTGFKKVQLTVLEGLLVYAPFELRFMNPWTVYHGFSAWRDYNRKRTGAEDHTSDYLGIKLEVTPVRGLRLYSMFAMTQFQTPYETSNYSDDNTPNGLAFQAGIESFIPYRGGFFHAWLEGTYTQPYIYIKESPNWSLVRTYSENIGDALNDPVYEWYGTPFGPDTIAGKIQFGYEKPGKWSVTGSYLLKVCGMYSGIKCFTEELDWGGEKIEDYNDSAWFYPDSCEDDDEAKRRRGMTTPTGTAEYINRIALRGTYNPTEKVSLFIEPSVTFVSNWRNISGESRTSWETALGTSIKFTK